MIFEEIDVGKIDQRIAQIEKEMAEVRKMENERKELEKIKVVLIEYFTVKSSSLKQVKETGIEHSQVIRTPYRTEQGWQRYQWFEKYGLLAFSFAEIGNLTNFIDGQTEEKMLERKSKEKMDDFKRFGNLSRVEQLLSRFLKKSEKTLPSPSEAVAV